MGEDRTGYRTEHWGKHRGEAGEHRVTLTEAAELLGTSRDAIRMRVKRGTLRSEKGEDGRRYVFVDPSRDRATNANTQAEDEGSPTATPLEELREQVGYLREQLRREQDAHAEARRIIAGLVQRVPELEAARDPTPPQEPSESDLTATDPTARGDVPDDRRSQEAQEPRTSPLKGWPVAALTVIIAMVSFGALLYLALAVLSP